MSYDLILPFFPEEIQTLLLDPTISDLMINGITGVYADRNGSDGDTSRSPRRTRTSGSLAAIERVARILGQDLTSTEPDPQHTAPRWFARGGGRTARFDQRPDAHHP